MKREDNFLNGFLLIGGIFILIVFGSIAYVGLTHSYYKEYTIMECKK